VGLQDQRGRESVCVHFPSLSVRFIVNAHTVSSKCSRLAVLCLVFDLCENTLLIRKINRPLGYVRKECQQVEKDNYLAASGFDFVGQL